MGHTAKLIAPQLAKPYVERGKNDAADAEALCEAASRPTMRYVPAKTVDQQAALMLAASRERLVRARTQLGNAIRGHRPWPIPRREHPRSGCKAAEFGLAADHAHVEARLDAVDAELRAWHKTSAVAQRLTQIPGVGLVVSSCW
jgi:transposase